jgi:hypothetical protein
LKKLILFVLKFKKIDEKRAITPRWIINFQIAGEVDLAVLIILTPYQISVFINGF